MDDTGRGLLTACFVALMLLATLLQEVTRGVALHGVAPTLAIGAAVAAGLRLLGLTVEHQDRHRGIPVAA